MKTCFKCNQTLPLTEFYKHKQMADGHLGKCKECTKKDVADRVGIKQKTDLDWTLEERERQRLKAEKKKMSGAAVQRKPRYSKEWRKRNPLKHAAHIILNNAIRDHKITKLPCSTCGSNNSQAHHSDYLMPLEVDWLCSKCHATLHAKEREKALIENFGK